MLHVQTSGSDYDTVVSLHAGTCGNLEEIACSDDANGTLQSDLSAFVASGLTYLVEITHFGTERAGGALQLTIDFTVGNLCGNGTLE